MGQWQGLVEVCVIPKAQVGCLGQGSLILTHQPSWRKACIYTLSPACLLLSASPKIESGHLHRPSLHQLTFARALLLCARLVSLVLCLTQTRGQLVMAMELDIALHGAASGFPLLTITLFHRQDCGVCFSTQGIKGSSTSPSDIKRHTCRLWMWRFQSASMANGHQKTLPPLYYLFFRAIHKSKSISFFTQFSNFSRDESS